ncbi:MAG TPA: hypothetical protein DIS88_09555 [Prevotella sp.]|nr:hypothetical protein [Prevotella sp.]
MVRIKMLLLIGFCLYQYVTWAGDEDSIPTISGSVYSEVNYGHAFQGSQGIQWDFPHLIIDGHVAWGEGWSVTAELEYERFRQDGHWDHNFRQCYSTNLLYVCKSIHPSIQVKAGILDVPVGITNHYGPALTIYDPESEAEILPMTWHEAGIAICGSLGKSKRWNYTLEVLAYCDVPLRNSTLLGTAARLDYVFPSALRIGISSYWGTSSHGMIHDGGPGYYGTDGIFVGDLDFDYQNHGWIIDGSAIYSSDKSAKSVGCEIGYDLFHASGSYRIQLIPFFRYDGFWAQGSQPLCQYTLGTNFSPLPHFVLKAEYGMRHVSGSRKECRMDLCFGYTIEF